MAYLPHEGLTGPVFLVQGIYSNALGRPRMWRLPVTVSWSAANVGPRAGLYTEHSIWRFENLLGRTM